MPPLFIFAPMKMAAVLQGTPPTFASALNRRLADCGWLATVLECQRTPAAVLSGYTITFDLGLQLNLSLSQQKAPFSTLSINILQNYS